jgi:hypothetical protein
VVVAGIGGVGSHFVISIARSAIKKIKIIDFDRISLNSLNRHHIIEYLFFLLFYILNRFLRIRYNIKIIIFFVLILAFR